MRFLSLFLLILSALLVKNAIANDNGLVANITPLMQAVVDRDLKGVEFFSNSGRVVINKKNDGGATALHIAARMGELSIVKKLIENGADVNVEDNEGWTPLMRAASFSFPKISKELLDSGARVDKANDNKDSAIMIASRSGCIDCLRQIANNAIFNKYLTKTDLKNELSKAFTISQKRNDEEMKHYIESMIENLNSLSKISYQENADGVFDVEHIKNSNHIEKKNNYVLSNEKKDKELGSKKYLLTTLPVEKKKKSKKAENSTPVKINSLAQENKFIFKVKTSPIKNSSSKSFKLIKPSPNAIN